jgi:hypothetical protein
MPLEIRSVAEAESLLGRVRAAADVAARRLKDLTVDPNDGLTVLRSIKLSEFGRHPLEDRDINLIEPVNQAWAYLVSLRAHRSFLLGTQKPEGSDFIWVSRVVLTSLAWCRTP